VRNCLVIAVLVVVSPCWSTADVMKLSSDELASITAGGAQTPLQMEIPQSAEAPQFVQTPQTIDTPQVGQTGQAAQTPGNAQPDEFDAPNLSQRESGVVVGSSRLVLRRTDATRLSGITQRHARVFRVVNAARSDVVTTINLQGRRSEPFGWRTALQTVQVNDIAQLDTGHAHLGRFDFESGSRRSNTSSARAFSRGDSAFAQRFVQNRVERSMNEDVFHNVFVPNYNPAVDISIPIGFDPPALTVPEFSVGAIVEDPLFGTEWGAELGIGPSTLDIGEFTVANLDFRESGLYLAPGRLDLPDLDIGSISGRACAAGCVSGSIDIPPLNLPSIESPIPEVRLGNNPLAGIDIQLGAGVAAAGRGFLRAPNGSGLTIDLTASLTVDVPDIPLRFDIGIPRINFLGIDVGPYTAASIDVGPIEIPALELTDLELFSESTPGFLGSRFEAEYDGVICLTNTNATCGGSSREFAETTESELEEASSESMSEWAEESWAEVSAEVVLSGASIRDAGAELIAMSDSSLDIEEVASVSLSGSQQNIRALDAVNAASAVVAAGLNLSASNATTTATGPRSGPVRLDQRSIFVQVR